MELPRHPTVLQNLELRLAQIRKALAELTDIQGQLQRNAVESKSNIQSSFSRQQESLRSREVHLLNQVDTLLQIKQEQLQQQAEGFRRELGALEVLLDQARGVELAETQDIMKRFQVLQLTPEEDASLSFEGDSRQLKNAILTFGCVNPKRPRLANEDGRSTVAAQIIGAFEQYADHKVWLCKVPRAQAGSGAQDVPHTVYPVFLRKDDSSIWLVKERPSGDAGNMSIASSETSDDDQDSFVVVDRDPDQLKRAFSTHFAGILNSPNLQWIRPSPSKMSQVGVSPHPQRKPCSYYRPSGSTKDWLRKPGAPVQGEQAMDTQVPSCGPNQLPAKPIEIEDLADLACVQDSPSGAPSPCSPKTSPNSRSQKNQTCCSSPPARQSHTQTNGIPDIDKVCKGNEKCHSFEECLCDENCGDAARRSNFFSGVPESSKNQWLMRSPGSAKEDLMDEDDKQPATPDEEMPREDYVKEWLASKTSPTTNQMSPILASFLKWQLEDNQTWLRSGDAGDSPGQQESTEHVKWLLKKAEAMEQDNKTTSDNQKNPTEWLIPGSYSCEFNYFKAPAGDATSWLQKAKTPSSPGTSLKDSKDEDALQEKWLMKQAFGMSPVPSPSPRFACFSAPVTTNQWIKK